ncbi:hypothetical protein PanWU01x14_285570 [Parasponia andersonii]|uniref:Uncharacterized protein n=1 Tax=Parasponia andersonii TaxID=3476 RepID=A0A2P5AZI1_PARAD|nr:hypothetical protein PanWU01x14_285570 [Parasponia andersonii]
MVRSSVIQMRLVLRGDARHVALSCLLEDFDSELERSSVDEKGTAREDALVESMWLCHIKWEIEVARVANKKW